MVFLARIRIMRINVVALHMDTDGYFKTVQVFPDKFLGNLQRQFRCDFARANSVTAAKTFPSQQSTSRVFFLQIPCSPLGGR